MADIIYPLLANLFAVGFKYNTVRVDYDGDTTINITYVPFEYIEWNNSTVLYKNGSCIPTYRHVYFVDCRKYIRALSLIKGVLDTNDQKIFISIIGSDGVHDEDMRTLCMKDSRYNVLRQVILGYLSGTENSAVSLDITRTSLTVSKMSTSTSVDTSVSTSVTVIFESVDTETPNSTVSHTAPLYIVVNALKSGVRDDKYWAAEVMAMIMFSTSMRIHKEMSKHKEAIQQAYQLSNIINVIGFDGMFFCIVNRLGYR